MSTNYGAITFTRARQFLPRDDEFGWPCVQFRGGPTGFARSE